MQIKSIFTIPVLFLLLTLTACSGASVTTPDTESNADSDAHGNILVFGAVEFEFNPVTREGEAHVINNRDLAISNLQYYPTPLGDVTVEADFVELDNSFNFHQGGFPTVLPTWQFRHEAEPSDSVYFTIKISNNEAGLDIHEPMVVVEFDQTPMWPIPNDNDSDFQYPDHYLVNGDGFTGWNGSGESCFMDPAVFSQCYNPYKMLDPNDSVDKEDPDFSISNVIEFQESDQQVLMVAIPESEYEPVKWTAYVLGYTGVTTNPAPLEIITPFEDESLPLITDDGSQPYLFEVNLRWPVGAIDPSNANLEMYLDLTQLATTGLPIVPLTPTAGDPLVWNATVDLSEANGYIKAINKVYLVPVMARQIFVGAPIVYANLNYPNQADFFVLPRVPELEPSGHHVVSYIGEDPISHQSDIFVQNAFSNESDNISNDQNVELFHTISADGNRVAWGYSTGTTLTASLWDRTLGSAAFEMPDILQAFQNVNPEVVSVDALSVPVISSDGTKVVLQVTWNESAFGLAIAHIDPGELPSDLTSTDYEVIWKESDIKFGGSDQILAISNPWISDIITYSFKKTGPNEYEDRNSWIIAFPFVANSETGHSQIAVILLSEDQNGMYIDSPLTQIVLAGNGEADPGPESYGSVRHPGYSLAFDRCHVVVHDGLGQEPNFGMLTYDAQEQGSFKSYRCPITFNLQYTSLPDIVAKNAHFVLGYLANPEPPAIQSGSINPIALNNTGSHGLDQLLSSSALEQSGLQTPGSFSVVRDGLERDSAIWLDYEYLDHTIGMGEFNGNQFSLTEAAGLNGGASDIPTISQGDFSLLDPAMYPAVAFDSMYTSTGDIYYLRWTGFFNMMPGKPTVTVKRLTYDGTARFPRLSGWILD